VRKTPWSIARVAHLGGIATRRALTPRQRKAAARQAARARWKRATKAQRSEAMRRRVLARWARVKAAAAKRLRDAR
jgi:hypothetical protein